MEDIVKKLMISRHIIQEDDRDFSVTASKSMAESVTEMTEFDDSLPWSYCSRVSAGRSCGYCKHYVYLCSGKDKGDRDYESHWSEK